jgi:uncharacterized membrane protein YgcG
MSCRPNASDWLFIAAAIMRPADAVLAAIGLGASLLAFILAGPQAYVWQKRVERLELHSLRFIVPVLALAAALLWLLISGQFRAGVLVLAGLTVLCLAIANSVANIAKSRQGSEHIERRRKLARARAYFRDQLMQPTPALRDEWFPYLIAFGLGSHMDKWFRAFGGQAASTRVSSVRSSSFGSSSPGSSWSGMGGGGGFAGGGSSGPWASAAGLMAAGVSAPSSSSSGGGGGGGGSSGGGGGGGW